MVVNFFLMIAMLVWELFLDSIPLLFYILTVSFMGNVYVVRLNFQRIE